MIVKEALENLSKGIHLSEEQAYATMNAIMSGEWTEAQIAGFLIALKIKGETVDEIVGFVHAMRDKATKITGPSNVIDTCGTGGDGTNTFNISTAAAIVAAATGVYVAKHGNRSVSSKCGSAEVLQELGVKIDLTPEQAKKCLEKVGMAFLFAPLYHTSMKHAVKPRKELGLRTVFNILGPMSNPANVKRQVIGAFNLETAKKMVKVLLKMQSDHILVVHSKDGMDEISLSQATHVHELKDGQIHTYTIEPKDVGLSPKSFSAVAGGNPKKNAQLLRCIFSGEKNAYTDITAFNAGAAIYTSGNASTLKEGVYMALDTIQSGNAEKKLTELVQFTNNPTIN